MSKARQAYRFILMGAAGYLLIAAALVLILCSTTGCRILRHTRRMDDTMAVTTKVTLADTILVATKETTTHVDSFIKKDTTVGIAGYSVTATIDSGTLDTGLLKRKVGNVTLRATKTKDGRTHIECTSDSLTIVISDLKSVIKYRQRQYDSMLYTKSVFHKTDSVEHVSTLSDVVSRSGDFWRYFLSGILVGAFLLIALGMYFKKM